MLGICPIEGAAAVLGLLLSAALGVREFVTHACADRVEYSLERINQIP